METHVYKGKLRNVKLVWTNLDNGKGKSNYMSLIAQQPSGYPPNNLCIEVPILIFTKDVLILEKHILLVQKLVNACFEC